MDYENIINNLDDVGWTIGEFSLCFTIGLGLYNIYKDKKTYFIKDEHKHLKELIMSITLGAILAVPNISNCETITISEVHSYTPDYVCTYPQRDSFHETIKVLKSKGYDIQIESYYMNAKTENTTPEKKRQIAQKLIDTITKSKPDYVYTTDDSAFEYVGIPLSEKFKVLASGLNRPISEYDILYSINHANLFAVEELFRLDQLYRLYETIDLKYPNYYFILEDPNDSSETSLFMEKNYRKEILGKGTITNIYAKSEKDLIAKLQDLNSKPFGVIVVISQKILDDGGDSYLGKDDIVKIVVKTNKKHLELGGNPDFVNLGISVSCSPSFYGMGETCGEKLISILESGMFSSGVMASLNKVVVNSKRLDELGLSDIYKKKSDVISNTIKGY